MSANKKFPKLAVLSLLGLLALTSCGSDEEVKSLPSNYNDPVITISDETEEIHNNLVSIIADQFQEGDLPSKTLDKVLYRYAQSIYGAYNKLTRADNDTSTTLKEAARIVNKKNIHEDDPSKPAPDADEMKTLYDFIRLHKAFWNYNDKGEHVKHDGTTPVEDDKTFEPCVEELNNVLSKFEDIEKRIAENMYTKAKTGSYTTKHFFKEYEFIKSLNQSGEKVIHYKKVQNDENIKPVIVDYTIEEKDVFEKEILHREFYQTNYKLNDDEEDLVGEPGDLHIYRYIEDEVVPQIYSDLLVEQYLLDEKSNAVKQSAARLINVIKIEKHGEFDLNADALKDQLVAEIYSRAPLASSDHLSYIDEENNPYYSIFEKYEDISKGLTTVVNTRDEDHFVPVTDKADPKYWDAEQIIYRITKPDSGTYQYAEKRGFKYYKNTSFGDLVEDYDKYLSNTDYNEIDESLRNKFTSNGTCSPEEGFDQERIALSQVETITKGWYVQKSSLTLDTSGEIKKALFQLGVANSKLEAKDDTSEILKKGHEEEDGYLAQTDRYIYENGKWDLRKEKSKKENRYICSINGAYFLKFEGQSSSSDYKDDIVCYDKSSHAYYICQVIEAVKDVKLRNSDSEKSYANTREAGFLNKVLSEVTTKVAETGSYSSLSKEYWLKKMDIVYHDQNVYDYFKNNYPDLFDDEE